MSDESQNTQSNDDALDDLASALKDDALLAEARDALKTQIDSNTEDGLRGKLPKRIGRYRIVSILGQGGMGTVFEAEQEHPKRAVALKVVRGGRFVDEHYVRLFQREAQTLARLKHPGIATIYEAGCTEDGQHFFAMELVRGVLLNRYVENKKLRIRPRLRIFRRICDAINYAHQRGVIHRDLKPSNILIDEEGRPKILDFGLARITDVDVARATIVTEVGKIQGTLAYMSPEQARGNPDEIDLRSDVYALGVILFELLTGSLPYNVEQSVLHEAVRSICEDAPRRPTSIDASLRGDLETIILKALAKEPSQRYHSAAALAEDIERFLTSQPILAQRPSTMYQLRKLVARHKAAFAFMAILFVLVSAFGIKWRSLAKAATEQSHLARTAEKVAQEQAETAGEVKEFLIRLFDVSDPNIASRKTPTLRAFLDRGAKKIDEELKGQEAVRATLMDTIGRVYRNLGLYDAAVPLLRKALEIRQQIHPGDHQDVAESLHNLGWLLRIKGDYAAAERLVRSALEMRRRLLGDADPTVADNKLTLGALRRYQAKYADALSLIREALAFQRAHLAACGKDEAKQEEKTAAALEVARCLETLAEALEEQGGYEEARQLAEEGLELRRVYRGAGHPTTASTIDVLALVLRDLGDYTGAEVLAREGLDIYERSVGDKHPFVVQASSSLGSFLRDQDRLADAEGPLRRAMDLCRSELPADHPYVASSATNLAWLLYDTGRYGEAEPLFREAYTFYRLRRGTAHPKTAEPLRGLGQTALAEGDSKRAESLLREAHSIFEAVLGGGHWSTAITESALGECLVAMERYNEAEPLLLSSYPIMEHLRGPEDRYVRRALKRMVDLYQAWRKPDEAAKYLRMQTEPLPAERPAHESEGVPTSPGN